MDGVFRQWVADTYKLMYCTRADRVMHALEHPLQFKYAIHRLKIWDTVLQKRNSSPQRLISLWLKICHAPPVALWESSESSLRTCSGSATLPSVLAWDENYRLPIGVAMKMSFDNAFTTSFLKWCALPLDDVQIIIIIIIIILIQTSLLNEIHRILNSRFN